MKTSKNDHTIIILTLLLFINMACSVQAPKIGKTETGKTEILEISEPSPGNEVTTRVSLEMGSGSLKVQGGSDLLLEGNIRYNIDSMKPTVNHIGDRLEINQKTDAPVLPTDDVINDWDLHIGNSPIELRIQAGAYEGSLDLGGTAITDLKIYDGASNTKVVFSSPNLVEMDELVYETGASSVEMKQLGNANFNEMTFRGGAGSYKLDFTGNLNRPAFVRIIGGVSNIRISIPGGMRTDIKVDGALNNIDLAGTWTVQDQLYQTTGTSPLLEIVIDSGVGNLSLIQE